MQLLNNLRYNITNFDKLILFSKTFLNKVRLRTTFKQRKLQIKFNEIKKCISRECCIYEERKRKKLRKIENQIMYL